MISAFWEMFKPLYAVGYIGGYTENEIAYLKELFGALPRVLRIITVPLGGQRRSTVSRTHGCCRNISEVGMAEGTGLLDSVE